MRAPSPEEELLDVVRDGVVVADPDLTIRYANPAIHRIAGYPPGELAAQPVLVLIPEDLRPAHVAGVARVESGAPGPLLQGAPVRTRLRRSDGGVVDIELALRAVAAPARFMAVIRPLDRLAMRTDAVLGAIGDGVYGLDREGRVQFLNPAAAKLTGRTEAEQLNRNQHELIHHHHPDRTPYPAEDCPILATLVDGQRREVQDDTFWAADDRPFPVDYTVSAIVEHGQVNGVVVSFRDANQRRQAERLRLLEATAEAQQHVIGELHRAVLPEPPLVEGYELHASFQPASATAPVGGDLYDWVLLPDGTLHICIVDVAGHDVTATKHALTTVHTIRALTLTGTPLIELLDRASALVEAHDPDLTATALVIRLDPSSGDYELQSAGHPPPLFVPAGGGPAYHLPGGTPLGAPRLPPAAPQRGHLAPGDALLAYTDGLIEHHGDLTEGMDALLEAVGDHRLGTIGRTLTTGATHLDDTFHLHIMRLEP